MVQVSSVDAACRPRAWLRGFRSWCQTQKRLQEAWTPHDTDCRPQKLQLYTKSAGAPGLWGRPVTCWQNWWGGPLLCCRENSGLNLPLCACLIWDPGVNYSDFWDGVFFLENWFLPICSYCLSSPKHNPFPTNLIPIFRTPANTSPTPLPFAGSL